MDVTNVAVGKTATQSSVAPGYSRSDDPAQDARGAISGDVTGGFGFHTGEQENPWWQVDLGGPHLIREVVIHNRVDQPEHQDRALPLEIWVSDDGMSFRLSHLRYERFGGKDGEPLRWSPEGREQGRFVRLTVPRRTCLHLDEVEIHGRRWDPTASAPSSGLGAASALGAVDAFTTTVPRMEEIAPADFAHAPPGAET